MKSSPSKAISKLLDDGFDIDDLVKLLESGWNIKLASCACGGNWSWTKPRDSGCHETFGCVCHRTKAAISCYHIRKCNQHLETS